MGLLENAEICLRALEPEDLESLYAWENEELFWADGNCLAPYSRFTLRQYIEEQRTADIFTSRQLRLIVELKKGRRAIGTVDLFDFDPYHSRAGVGILIDRDFQSLGYASQALALLCGYAFRMLKLHQLYSHVNERNVASVRLFEGAGFERCGRLRAWNRVFDGWQDCLLFQMVCAE